MRLEWGVASRPFPGQVESGDAYVFKEAPPLVLAAVVDGLGHGPQAALAAERATETLTRHASEDPVALMKHCHEALKGTRGAAVTLVAMNLEQGSLRWLGVGNVEGVLLPPGTNVKQHAIPRGGVVGEWLPSLHVTEASLEAGSLLLLATDGIKSCFWDQVSMAGGPQQIADRVMAQFGKETDDALVMVVRYVRE